MDPNAPYPGSPSFYDWVTGRFEYAQEQTLGAPADALENITEGIGEGIGRGVEKAIMIGAIALVGTAVVGVVVVGIGAAVYLGPELAAGGGTIAGALETARRVKKK